MSNFYFKLHNKFRYKFRGVCFLLHQFTSIVVLLSPRHNAIQKIFWPNFIGQILHVVLRNAHIKYHSPKLY